MPIYQYQAVDVRTGRELRGELDSASEEQAIAALQTRHLLPMSLREGRKSGALPAWRERFRAGRTAKAAGRPIFTRRLAALLRAGVPLLRALELLERQSPAPGWPGVISHLARTIRGGGALSVAMAEHPGVFPAMYLGIVRAGETSGRLDASLERLAEADEKAQRLRRRVTGAMLYPAVVATVAVGIVTALMVFVVPRFEAVFAGLLKGQPLPPLTQVVIGVARFGQSHALAVVLALACAVAGCIGLLRTSRGRELADRMLLRLPLLGDLASQAAVARVSRTLGSLLEAGVPILAALRVAAETAGNTVVRDALGAARSRVEAGEPLARPLVDSGRFPAMMTGMVEVGEETGSLPEMLVRVAETYDEEVDRSVHALTTLMEPVLIVGMAAVVGTIVIALFLPIVRIIQLLA